MQGEPAAQERAHLLSHAVWVRVAAAWSERAGALGGHCDGFRRAAFQAFEAVRLCALQPARTEGDVAGVGLVRVNGGGVDRQAS